jgi:hypothetical protein
MKPTPKETLDILKLHEFDLNTFDPESIAFDIKGITVPID